MPVVVRNYRVIRPLGVGGMGEVYLAQDTRLERSVALKLLPVELASDPNCRQRFLTEAKAIAALNHPSICAIYDVGEAEDGRPFIVMELLEGETLEARLKRGSMPWSEVLEVGLQLADGLSAAHAKGVVHRDIKPSNLHLTLDGRVRMLDFGVAKRVAMEGQLAGDPTQALTLRGQLLGTPSYMSPEQALGKEVDIRSDLFSLGVVLYELASGRAPFAGQNLTETLDRILHATPESLTGSGGTVPGELDRIILKCLRKEPAARYQTAREVLVDLQKCKETLRASASGKTTTGASVSGDTGLVVTLLFVGTNAEELERSLGALEANQLLDAFQDPIQRQVQTLTQAAIVHTTRSTWLLRFARPSSAVQFALRIQTQTVKPLACRIAIHLGEVVNPQGRTAPEQFGENLVICERLLQLARPGQVLLSRAVFDSARQGLKRDHSAEPLMADEKLGALTWLDHGPYLLEGVEDAVEVCEIVLAGRVPGGPPTGPGAQRSVLPSQDEVLGWRPALGQAVPGTKWVLERKLGEGGFGEVWLGCHDTLKEHRVFKFCFRADRVRSLKREMTLFRLLKERLGDHPNMVRLLEVNFDEPPFYVVMDYSEGSDLKDWCAAQGGAANVPLTAKLEIVAQVADGLEAAHETGVIHRDVKPANILVSGRPGVSEESNRATNPPLAARPSVRVKLTDFGIGQVVSEEALAGITRTGFTQTMVASSSSSQTGSQMYMAPELLAAKPASARSDIYSLGVVLFQLLVGDFSRPVTLDWENRIPDPILREDLKRCFAGNPEERFDKAKRLAEHLRSWDERRRALGQKEAAEARRKMAALRWRRARALSLAALVLALGGSLLWFFMRSGKARWARETALPEVARLAKLEEYIPAFALAQEVEKYLPADPGLTNLWPQISVRANIETTPEGADVSFKDYRQPTSPWQSLGKSPLRNFRMPRGFHRWQIKHPDHPVTERADYARPEPQQLWFGLTNQFVLGPRELPSGMVYVHGGRENLILTGLDHIERTDLGDYLIDQFEVSNRQFKEFVDHNGYATSNYWKQPFLKNGVALPWAEAVAQFRDATGRPGPATWRNGRFPDGEADYPVRGISWFEAAAYADFAGKRLPSIFHWNRAATILFSAFIVPPSNFSAKGPAPAGKYQGMSGWGAYDMAGNVKEWCWNEATDGRRYVLGGACGEPDYMFPDPDAQSPFDRSATYGLRCIKLLSTNHLATRVDDPIISASRNYAVEQPVSDDVFQIYRSLFAYDKTELNARVEAVDDKSKLWRKEKVSFDAAYGKERVPAYLFIPKDFSPPYQALVYFPGGNAIFERSSENLGMKYMEFLIESGRAVIYPIYKGTHERADGLTTDAPTATTMYRDHVVQWSKDLGRTIDYLETRKDIRADKIAYCGVSWGGAMGALLPSLEPRLKVNIMVVGGFNLQKTLPEVDQINFAPHVTQPTLMLNGRYDFFFPVETSQRHTFRLLGTPPEHKRHMIYNTGHSVPREEFVHEILAWLDKYLGPTK